jgi:hypothetical protein
LNPQVCRVTYLVGGGYAWSHWREGIEALSPRPLFVFELDVSGGDVVETRVSKNVVFSVFNRDVFAFLANNNG